MKANDKDSDSRRENPKERDPLGQDTPFVVLLVLLAVLLVILWFADPDHQPHGESRGEWPPPVSTKP